MSIFLTSLISCCCLFSSFNFAAVTVPADFAWAYEVSVERGSALRRNTQFQEEYMRLVYDLAVSEDAQAVEVITRLHGLMKMMGSKKKCSAKDFSTLHADASRLSQGLSPQNQMMVGRFLYKIKPRKHGLSRGAKWGIGGGALAAVAAVAIAAAIIRQRRIASLAVSPVVPAVAQMIDPMVPIVIPAGGGGASSGSSDGPTRITHFIGVDGAERTDRRFIFENTRTGKRGDYASALRPMASSDSWVLDRVSGGATLISRCVPVDSITKFTILQKASGGIIFAIISGGEEYLIGEWGRAADATGPLVVRVEKAEFMDITLSQARRILECAQRDKALEFQGLDGDSAKPLFFSGHLKTSAPYFRVMEGMQSRGSLPPESLKKISDAIGGGRPVEAVDIVGEENMEGGGTFYGVRSGDKYWFCTENFALRLPPAKPFIVRHMEIAESARTPR